MPILLSKKGREPGGAKAGPTICRSLGYSIAFTVSCPPTANRQQLVDATEMLLKIPEGTQNSFALLNPCLEGINALAKDCNVGSNGLRHGPADLIHRRKVKMLNEKWGTLSRGLPNSRTAGRPSRLNIIADHANSWNGSYHIKLIALPTGVNCRR